MDDELEKLKITLDALCERHTEVLFERDQITNRRATLLVQYEELRIQYRELKIQLEELKNATKA